MTKYFYTDPLAAAWMAKWHGMRFTNFSYDDENNESDYMGSTIHFHIHPDTLHLLAPINGDIATESAGSGIILIVLANGTNLLILRLLDFVIRSAMCVKSFNATTFHLCGPK